MDDSEYCMTEPERGDSTDYRHEVRRPAMSYLIFSIDRNRVVLLPPQAILLVRGGV